MTSLDLTLPNVAGDETAAIAIPDADGDETAAIAAALTAYLRAEELAISRTTGDDTWEGTRWSFTGRLAGLDIRSDRVPLSAPTNPWTAAGRADRY